MEQITLDFQGNMRFTADVSGHKLDIDGAPENGGNDLGPRPKPLMLVALGGCTGMDIASLARKMRVDMADFKIEVEAEKSVDTVPMTYVSAKIVYRFEASASDKDKIIKMVTMSQERYCGVNFMLQKAFPITFDIYLNGAKLEIPMA